MKRKLFCELCPLTYKISVLKCIFIRHLQNHLQSIRIAKEKSNQMLPVVVHSHKSLIRRTLGTVDLELQENKAVNLAISAPKVSHIVIRPGETFSFWSLVGSCSAKKGYQKGLIIKSGMPDKDIGGGMCQFTNLIHWLILHTPLEVVEHHHHDGVDLFPDYGRQVPFGVGTSIMYNYLDYRFYNNTDFTFQLITYTDETYLCGEIRANKPLPHKYHIKVKEEYFTQEKDGVYRNSQVYREVVDKTTGNLLKKEQIKSNHAKVLYDTAGLQIHGVECMYGIERRKNV